ncbi:MAG: sigma-54 dependent transcriptional regulator [Candidatus Pacebacteria bacterium]|nr:sigma-54 dependent transcriptional regulator [Candidatus Paceibacterota bacterium]
MQSHKEILVIEDDPVLTRLIGHWLESQHWRIEFAESLAAARLCLAQQNYPLILLDLHLPDGDGIGFLRQISRQDSRENSRQTPSQPAAVIAMTARGSVATAVAAMQAGAYDFLVKPFTPERLIVTITNATERQKLHHIVNHYPPEEKPPAPDGSDPTLAALGMIGASLPMRELAKKITLVAPSRAAVFLHGESGSGKELAAAAIHRLSPRRDQAFIALNCAALPHDLIESEIFGHVKGAFTGAVQDRDGAASRANKGTLFFDEIAEMDISVQAKLLRFIQTGEFTRVGGNRVEKSDIRFISATHRDLERDCAAGRFREDLFYRLVVMPLTVPPLRDRGDDFLLLARHFLKQFVAEENRSPMTLAPSTEKLFRNHDWPGNIRQLQNIIRQIVVMNEASDEVTAEMLPPEFFTRGDSLAQPTAPSAIGNFSLEVAESNLIKAALAAHQGNLTHTAAALGINLSTLRRRLKSQERFG